MHEQAHSDSRQLTYGVQIAQNQNYRTNHEKRQIRRQLAGIHEPYSHAQENPGKQAPIKFHWNPPLSYSKFDHFLSCSYSE